MRNFYYVQSCNMAHPAVQEMLGRLHLYSLYDSLVDLKAISKPFIGFYEAVKHAQIDFDRKLPSIFPVEKGEASREANLRVITVMNPKFALPNDLSEEIAEKFGEQHGHWDDDCCGTMFFCEASEDDDDEEDDSLPDSWLFKYEIHFVDDNIKLLQKNGEYAFDPADLPLNSYTSSVH